MYLYSITTIELYTYLGLHRVSVVPWCPIPKPNLNPWTPFKTNKKQIHSRLHEFIQNAECAYFVTPVLNFNANIIAATFSCSAKIVFVKRSVVL